MKKNLKNGITYVLAGMIFMSSTTIAYAQESEVSNIYGTTINVDTMFQYSNIKLLDKKGYLLASFDEFFNLVGANATLSDDGKIITVIKNNTKTIFEVGSKIARSNNIPIHMSSEVISIDEDIYVPVESVCFVLGMNMSFDSEYNSLNIYTNQDYIYLTDALNNLSNYNDFDYITIGEAVEMSLLNNSNLQSIEDTKKYQNTLISDFKDDIDKLKDENYDAVKRNINDLTVSVKNLDINKEIISDTSEYTILNILNNMETIKISMALLNSSIPVEEANVNILEARHEYGLSSKDELDKAKNNLSSSKLNLSNLELSLSDLQRMLDNHLNISNGESKNIEISLEKDLSKIDNINLDTHIQNSYETDLNIEMYQNLLSTARTNKSTYSDDASDSDKVKLNNEISTQNRAIEDRKTDLKDALESTYNSMLQLKDKHETLLISLENAKIDYNTAIVNLSAGNIIANQVEQAKISIQSIEKDIEANKIEFSLLYYKFFNTHLL